MRNRENVICFLLIWIPVIVLAWMVALRLTAPASDTNPAQNVVTYEDGSGVQFAPGSNREIRTFPEGTFAWDCATMGNLICGKAAK